MKHLSRITNLFHVTEVKKEREAERTVLVICGWFEQLEKGGNSLHASLDKKALEIREKRAEGMEIRLKYLRVRANIDVEFTCRITLPEEDVRQCNSFVLFEEEKGRKVPLLKLSQRALEGVPEQFWTPRKQKLREIWISEGAGGFYRRIRKKLGKEKLLSYEEFQEMHRISGQELLCQKQEYTQAVSEKSESCPVFYVLPVCGSVEQSKEHASALLDSLKKQSFAGWKLLKPEDTLLKTGYVLVVDHRVSLAPEALYLAYRQILKNPGMDFLYADEDYKEEHDRRIPNFKPDANEDLLRSLDYPGSFCLVSAALYRETGGYQGHFYDYHLRCWEKASIIGHIPRVLAHNEFSWKEVWNIRIAEEGRSALEGYFQRLGISGKIRLDLEDPEFPRYHTEYDLAGEPLISVIIPNKDHREDLAKCVDSILQKSTYSHYEILIVENNSTEPETFVFYRELEKRDSRIRILFWKEGFNYSKINNFAAARAKGSYLLFLNNDTEVITPFWMEELLGRCMQEDAGITGVQLFYGDGTIQHAGVIIGMGGLAGHAFGGLSTNHAGYRRYGCTMQDLSAVTAACMLVERETFEKAGGFCEELAVAFNDIDLCLAIRQQGKFVVYNPYVKLYHHESKSRGMEDTPEKVKRFHEEVCLFAERHPWILKRSDPYYNPNLTIDRNDFSLNPRK